MITTSPFAVNTNFDILAAGERIAADGIVLNGVPLTFMASGSTDLQRTWTLGDGTIANEQTLQHTYATAGDYTVTLTVTDNAGCKDSAEKSLHIEDIIITDAISPNGDGKNDRLVITPFLYEAELKIMDRAGRTVYQASPYNNDFSGQNLESDVYYYELQFKETGKSYKGYVHVIK
jgi:gliding motility-associated-like protein